MKNKFKYLGIIVLIAIIGFLFTACGDEDDDFKITKADFYGIWKSKGTSITSATYVINENILFASGYTISELKWTEKENKSSQDYPKGYTIEGTDVTNSQVNYSFTFYIAKDKMSIGYASPPEYNVGTIYYKENDDERGKAEFYGTWKRFSTATITNNEFNYEGFGESFTLAITNWIMLDEKYWFFKDSFTRGYIKGYRLKGDIISSSMGQGRHTIDDLYIFLNADGNLLEYVYTFTYTEPTPGNVYVTSSGNSKDSVNETAPNTPTGLKASAFSSSSINLSWQMVVGADGYTVYRDTKHDGLYSTSFRFSQQYGGSGETGFTANFLEANTTYFFKVSAVKYADIGIIESIPSDWVQATTLTDSSSGTGWIEVTDFPFSIRMGCIAWGNDKFVAVGTSGEIAYSYDGIIWTTVDNSPFGTSMITGVAWGNDMFVAVGVSGKMAYSSNGEDWTAVVNSTFDSDISSITWGNNMFVAGGGVMGIAYSLDGITWTRTGNSDGNNSIVWGNDKFVGVGGYINVSQNNTYSSYISYSSNGTTWTRVTNNPFGSSPINSVEWGNNKFVAVGDSGKIAHSSNGVNWTAIQSSAFNSSTYIRNITWGNNKFVAVGFEGTVGKIAYSLDGITWIAINNHPFTSSQINSVEWGNNKFVAGGSGKKMAYWNGN